MCGICGIVRLQADEPIRQGVLLAMRDSMAHRGPDDEGIYLDERAGLGSRRLSILDLSPRGRMPMACDDGRFWIVHNGEVYNYQELRLSLERKGYSFRTRTDTEVLLKLYIEQGPAMLERCNGMFAFAIWDAQEQTLFLARDRVGIKPLYYTLHRGSLYFASEQKALFAAGAPAVFDESTWDELLFFRYVSGERTPYKGVTRLLPGHYMLAGREGLRIHRWWSIRDLDRSDSPVSANKRPATAEHFRRLFDASIALRRISDVPLGVLLSGGTDSSGVAAILAQQAGSGVASFSVRFAEPEYDEGPLAQQVAERYGLEYHELFVDSESIPALIEQATWLLDEPLVHGNDVHILAISRYAKPRVTVLLSGEGADEIFGGYVRYRFFAYERFFPILRALARLGGGAAFQNGRLRKVQQLLQFRSLEDSLLFSSAEVFPAKLFPDWRSSDAVLDYRKELVTESGALYGQAIRRMMYYEQHTYLQSVLDRNDRMTMGASIECRVPYLDHRIVEWAAQQPLGALFERGKGKAVLRHALADRLPDSVLRHRKWGFGVPWQRYFRQNPALRAWIQRLPSAEILQDCPLDRGMLRQAVEQFLAGDDRLMPVVRQLVFITLWHKICVQRQSNPL